MACEQPNPCPCVGTYTPNDDCPSSSCDCLNLGYITVFPDDGVGPCGQAGTVSFTDCFDFCACENEVATLTVVDVSAPDSITINSVNQSGLTYTTTSEANAYDKITVVLKGTCTSKDDEDLQLGDYTVITIYIKDLCKNVVCGAGETCDKCTGECEDDINLTVE